MDVHLERYFSWKECEVAGAKSYDGLACRRHVSWPLISRTTLNPYLGKSEVYMSYLGKSEEYVSYLGKSEEYKW